MEWGFEEAEVVVELSQDATVEGHPIVELPVQHIRTEESCDASTCQMRWSGSCPDVPSEEEMDVPMEEGFVQYISSSDDEETTPGKQKHHVRRASLSDSTAICEDREHNMGEEERGVRQIRKRKAGTSTSSWSLQVTSGKRKEDKASPPTRRVRR